MTQGLLAPLYTALLFSVCVSLSAFFRLAVGKPVFKQDKKPSPRPQRAPERAKKRVYFVADLKPFELKDDAPRAEKTVRKKKVSR